MKSRPNNFSRKMRRIRKVKIIEQNNKCFYCEREFIPGHKSMAASGDHLIPVSLGGTNDRDNIVAACIKCNVRRGTKDWVEFLFEKNPTLINALIKFQIELWERLW